jgi:hypothetical protein
MQLTWYLNIHEVFFFLSSFMALLLSNICILFAYLRTLFLLFVIIFYLHTCMPNLFLTFMFGLHQPQVNVCDICGDVGREYLLATCTRCLEGAEHT